MTRKPKTSETVASLKHKEVKRKDTSTAEYQSVIDKEDRDPVKVAYPRAGSGLQDEKEQRHRDLDPQLVWRNKGGKADADHITRESEQVKGYRGADATVKKSTMDTYWVPGVNHLGTHGRWAFAEFTDVYAMQEDFAQKVEAEFDQMIQATASNEAMEA